MSTEREELAKVIAGRRFREGTRRPQSLLEQADAILAAGYRKPQQVTTVEELDALPEGSVILGGGVVPRIKAAGGHWVGEGIDVDSAHIIEWVKDATVLHVGGAE